MNYYYCETCEVKLKETDLQLHAMDCLNLTRISLQDYEDNEECEIE